VLFGGGLIAGRLLYVRSPLYTQQQDPIDSRCSSITATTSATKGSMPLLPQQRGEIELRQRPFHLGVPELPLADLEQEPKLAPVREASLRPAIVWNKSQAAALRLLQPFDPREQGVGCVTCTAYRSWRSGEVGATHHGLVPGLPPESGALPAAREEVTSMTFTPGSEKEQLALGERLKTQYT